MRRAAPVTTTYGIRGLIRQLSVSLGYADGRTAAPPNLRTLALIAVLSASCAPAPVSYEQEVATLRAEKDAAFKAGEDSPIPAAARGTFTGLNYFEIDPSFRVAAALAENEMSTRVIEMDTTDGTRQRMRVIGTLEFTLGGERRALTAYVPETARDTRRLFVPFRDATNRAETYGGGRYLDLERSSIGIYDLDFNRAYNPFCVYDIQYVCPLPPPENSLDIAVRAGEKMPEGKVMSFEGSGVREFGGSLVAPRAAAPGVDQDGRPRGLAPIRPRENPRTL